MAETDTINDLPLAALSAMLAKDSGTACPVRYPDIRAGVDGVRWVENCVRSADLGSVWIEYR